MHGSKPTHIKHLPNVLLTSASQNYISGEHVLNKALTQAARSIKAAKLARLMDARAVSHFHLTAALRVWKSATDMKLLGRIEEVLTKLHPFEGTRGKLPEGNSEDSIIVAAFSPASRLESELEMRQLDVKLVNLTRLLEAWKGKIAASQLQSVGTQTQLERGDSLLESRGDLLKDSLQLQDTEPKLEDRKLESLLAIDESYEMEHTSMAKISPFADITETEFIGNLPDRDPSLLIMRLKGLEKQLTERENRLIQLTKTTHHELELLIQEREQIAKERKLYANLEDIRNKLAIETFKLKTRSHALDLSVRKQRDQIEAVSLQTSEKEEACDHFQIPQKSALLKWLQTNLLLKPHNQKVTKTLSFNVWKAASKLKSKEMEEKKGAGELNWPESGIGREQAYRLQENDQLCELFRPANELKLGLKGLKFKDSFPHISDMFLRAVFRNSSLRYLKRLQLYWNNYRLNTMTTATIRPHSSSFPAIHKTNRLFSLRKRRLLTSRAFASWKDFSSTYENKLLRSHLTLFDISLQNLQRQDQAFQAQILISQSQMQAKIALLSSLLKQYCM